MSSSVPVRSAIRKLKGYSLVQPEHRIKLNQNESPYDLPEALKSEVLKRLAGRAWNRYPSPFPHQLQEKIARLEGWVPEGVVVASGSNVLIQGIIVAGAVDGTIVTVQPTFSLYGLEGELLGNKIVSVPLEEDFSLPIEKFIKVIRQTRPNLIFLPNPNAPTGNLFPEDTLVRILQSTKSLVVVDEAYCHFARYTLLPHLKKFPNLILVRTLSKAFSLGGVRIGYLMAAPRVAKEIQKVVLPFNVGVLAEVTAEVVLDNPGYVEERVKEAIEQREWLYREMRQLPNLIVYPSRANYLLFRSSKMKKIFSGLIEQGILIRQISGKGLENTLRVTIGSPAENREFLTALKSL